MPSRITPPKKTAARRGVKRPSKRQIADHAWATENPTRRGLQPNGMWAQYPDPAGVGKMDAGPGSLVRNSASPDGVLEDKKYYTTAEVEQPWIDNYNNGWKAISQAYDQLYGNSVTPHPSDTINALTQLLAVSTRGKFGTLHPADWPSFYKAMSTGDIAEQLAQSRTKFKDDKGNWKYDNDRVRREAEALWPGRFDVTWDKDNPQKKTIVKPRKR